MSHRSKTRSPGVMLRGRAAGFHYYDDEVRSDGGKARLHRRVRRTEAAAWRREARTAATEAR